MKVGEILSAINSYAPFAIQETYDNSGLQIGHPDKEVRKMMITLDVTTETVDEALESGADVLLSHHPLFFKGIRSIDLGSVAGQIVEKAFRGGLTILSAHTNYDNVPHGTNQALADFLGLKDVVVLQPKQGLLKKLVTFCPDAQADTLRAALFDAGAGHIGKYDSCSYNVPGMGTFRASEGAKPFVGNIGALHTEPETRIEVVFPGFLAPQILQALLKAHPYEEVAYDIYALENDIQTIGSGLIGQLAQRISGAELLRRISTITNSACMRYAGNLKGDVERIALCGGSGAFLIPRAVRLNADAFITADLKYHDFAENNSGLLLIDAGHYETEVLGLKGLAAFFMQKFPNFAVQISKTGKNPVKYHV
jgi:dinuclear metal center YbgI/SA1388 family protein